VKISPRILLALGVAVIAIGLGAIAVWRSLGHAYWVPSPQSAFLIKLASPLDVTSPTDLGHGESNYLGNPAETPTVYDIDGNANTSATVDYLHSQGAHVICYVPVGEWAPYIYDANNPLWAALKGQAFGATDRWLDTNPSGPHYSALITLVTAEFQMCRTKGFDAIQPDGIDEAEGYGVRFDGVPLTVAEVNVYLEQLTQIAHSLGLSIAQLNYVDQSAVLSPYFDFVVVESCDASQPCGDLEPYVQEKKAIFEIEYKGMPAAFCPAALAAGRVAGLYDRQLDAKLRIPCK
jgi:hypothetical protein